MLPLLLWLVGLQLSAPAGPDHAAVLATAITTADRTARDAAAAPTPPGLGSRDLFLAALIDAECSARYDRIAPLLARATAMQDRDPNSRSYGNFRWSWKDPTVMDFNAVEFCMQSGTLLYHRHRDKLPAAAQTLLDELLRYSVEGCLRHRVSASYTNIAFMNVTNLALLGEWLGKSEVAVEGYRRLETCAREVWDRGIHEYDSPTYYGVDLDDLLLLQQFAGRAEARDQAGALLQLFYQDIAANWFPPADKLAGTCSRDYDYLRGLGYLQTPLWVQGWITGRTAGGGGVMYSALTDGRPDPALRAWSSEHLPRLVRQRWGASARETKTHYLLPDITLGTSAGNYGTMDIPLAITFPGPATGVRGYFIADGRHDPYGKVKIPEGNGAHEKTLHLTPFWTAAQTKRDALTYTLYRAADLPKGFETLESHVVLPRECDGLWIGDRAVDRTAKTWSLSVPAGAAVVLRRGSAMVGLKVLAARGIDGKPAAVQLVDDGNAFGAIRLTVAHHAAGGTALAAVCLHTRIGGGLRDEAAATAWRAEFAASQGTCVLSEDGVQAQVDGPDGVVAIEVGTKQKTLLTPRPTRGLLEIDGNDVGRQILAAHSPWKGWTAQAEPPRLVLMPGAPLAFEAESGAITPPFVVADDGVASGGKYVWSPGEVGARGSANGAALAWRVHNDRATRGYLWARVIAPTPEDDSFFVALAGLDGTGAEPLAWSLKNGTAWTWVPFEQPLEFGAGDSLLEIRGREDGAKIDALKILPRPEDRP